MKRFHLYWIFFLLGLFTFNNDLYAKSKSKKGPVFHVVTLNNDSLTIGGTSDKVTVLNFWATWCSPCIAEMPSLNKLVKANSDQVIFIAITDETQEVVQNFFDNREIEFIYHQVVDRKDIADSYKANKSFLWLRKAIAVRPVHVVIDKDGNVVFHEASAAENIDKKIQTHINKCL